MRHLLLATGKYTTATNDISTIGNGLIGIYYFKDSQMTLTTTGTDVKGEANIVVGRDAEQGGPLVIPFYPKDFSYVKGEYQAPTKFAATFVVPAPTAIGDYSIIIAKKGIKFNERNKWTATVHVKDVTIGAAGLAAKLLTEINNNTIGHGLTATVADATITFAASDNQDYAIIGADLLWDVKATVTSIGNEGYGSAKYVQDLAEKAAADAGFEYTYRDAYTYLYPNYPLNPLKNQDAEDTGFTIYTLKFAEPRNVKTTDEAVKQIVQIAVPTKSEAIATLDAVFAGLAGESTTSTDTNTQP